MQKFPRHASPRFSATQRELAVTPDIWVKCPSCNHLIYRRQLQDQHKVCPSCDHHFRLTAHEWLDLILDPQSFRESDGDLEPVDALNFHTPQEHYAAKLERAQCQTGLLDAVVCGSGTINTSRVEIAVTDFCFMGGSMGSVYGEKIAAAAERAVAQRTPLITINASGGARMHEGVFSLMQMAKVAVVLALLARARQLHISVLVDPCYGGVSASYASIADVILVEPGAHVGFAGPRVIEQTTKETLPDDFQSAERLLSYGMVDRIVPRAAMRSTLAQLIRIHAPNPKMSHYYVCHQP